MDYQERVREQKTAVEEYARLWKEEDSRSALGVSEESAAYHLLLHTAALERFSGSRLNIQDVLMEDDAEFGRLLKAALRYSSRLVIADRASCVLAGSSLSQEDYELLEGLVLMRDGQEMTISLASELARDLVENGDREVLSAISNARSNATAFDILFEEQNPEVGLALCEGFADLAECVRNEPDRSRFWWLFGREKLQAASSGWDPMASIRERVPEVVVRVDIGSWRRKLAGRAAAANTPVASILVPSLIKESRRGGSVPRRGVVKGFARLSKDGYAFRLTRMRDGTIYAWIHFEDTGEKIENLTEYTLELLGRDGQVVAAIPEKDHFTAKCNFVPIGVRLLRAGNTD